MLGYVIALIVGLAVEQLTYWYNANRKNIYVLNFQLDVLGIGLRILCGLIACWLLSLIHATGAIKIILCILVMVCAFLSHHWISFISKKKL